jgi:Fibronectin type III domain
MDWLILILGVPAILIPLVLLFGFAGCAIAHRCTDDGDCPAGMRCVDGMCVDASMANPPPSAPQNLVAVAIDDRSVSLTWINTDPAATDFRIERSSDGGEFAAIPAPADLSPAGATDASGLQEGVTYIYRVRARLGGEVSEPSETSSATVFPAAPVNLVATPVSLDRIDLSWSPSATATEYSLEHAVPNGAFAEFIPRPTGTTFSHSGLGEGTRHEYRVSAIVVDGFQNDVPQEVKSVPSATVAATTLAFTAAFTAPPGTLTTDETGWRGYCLVQRVSRTHLAAGGTQVRMLLRGSTTGSLTLDRLTISQPAATGDPYDAAPDLTDLASGLTIPPNTAVTVGPVNYTLDPTQDLLIAFDISNTPGEGNQRFGPLTGSDSFYRAATAEAGVQDRTTGYVVVPNTIYLIETIEVL